MANNTLRQYRGEAKVWAGQVMNNGVPVDITGWVLYFTVRKDYPGGTVSSDADATFKKVSTSAAEITLTNPSAGNYEIFVNKSDTFALEWGDYVYGLEGAPAAGTEPVVLDQGPYPIDPDVVRGV